jgi:hypothetical protein
VYISLTIGREFSVCDGFERMRVRPPEGARYTHDGPGLLSARAIFISLILLIVGGARCARLSIGRRCPAAKGFI